MEIFKKSRAKSRIEITVDSKMDPDGWFYTIAYIDNKSGKITHEHCVIKKDLDGWISGLECDGWVRQVN
jgi:hypothetical protein